MFTGIVEAVGAVKAFDADTNRLVISFPPGAWPDPLIIGESVSISGCCLTVVEFTSNSFDFDLSDETLNRSSLGELNEASQVNLERAMRADGRFGGHIVQGHVDATGTLLGSEAIDGSVVMRFAAPMEFDKFLIDKGSVAVEGVSLTVVRPLNGEFEVWVIPHTLRHTNLGGLTPGMRVNLEFDVVAKYLAKWAGPPQ